MPAIATTIVQHAWFQRIIVAMILLAGVLAGLETNAALVAQHGALLHTLDWIVLGVFVVEAALKLTAQRGRYFSDGWNVFDFTIVVLCLLPIQSQFAVVLRLVRALRLLRLVTALPKLQLLVGALLKSISSMGYVSLLLGLMFYIYAVAGVHLFSVHDAEHFGSLSVALLALFQIITLDNWSDLFGAVSPHAPLTATLYFVSFILLGTMIMLNLFIGVITNSMAEMHTELESQEPSQRSHQPPDEESDRRRHFSAKS
jgi:voltage-gated sodium channel